MSTITNFTELDCWKLSRSLSKAIFIAYNNNISFKRDHALRDQIRRSSGSIMDNIAEGFGRGNNKEFINFLGYSSGSAAEVKSQIYRAYDSEYITEEIFKKFLEEVSLIETKIHRLQAYLKKTEIRGIRHYVAEESEEISYENFKEFENMTFPWPSKFKSTQIRKSLKKQTTYKSKT